MIYVQNANHLNSGCKTSQQTLWTLMAASKASNRPHRIIRRSQGHKGLRAQKKRLKLSNKCVDYTMRDALKQNGDDGQQVYTIVLNVTDSLASGAQAAVSQCGAQRAAIRLHIFIV